MTGFQNSIYELANQIRAGQATSADLVRRALEAIASLDQDGSKLNSVSELNPFCLYEAEAADQEIAAGKIRSPLHGIPILVKDNIDVKGLHTTAGSYALHDLIADKDCPVIAKLKAAGAIILGKSNMSEFAYWMSSEGMPSGFSSLSGQVVHAYNPAFDPSGSSSGSAVAVSAGFVPGAIGSETCGSLMSPGIANAIVSLKPTVGLVSRTGIIPISHTQDTAGPMANTVEDCAIMLTVMAGRDEEDPATWRIPVENSRDKYDATGVGVMKTGKIYENYLTTDLTGCRIGVYTDHSKSQTEKEVYYQQILKEKIIACGAIVVEIEYDDTNLECEGILTWEFRNGIERYLAVHNCQCRTLQDIIDFNKTHAERCLVHGQNLLEASNECSGMLKEAEYIRQRMEMNRRGKELITDVINKHQLDCLVTATGEITSFAAVYGTCSMVIPAAPFDAEVYSPVSYFFVGKPFEEEKILRVAYAVNQK